MSVEQAARSELSGLPEGLRGSTLAATVVDLAIRLDSEPSDRDAAALSRELRMVLADLHRLARGTGTEEEEIVGRVSDAALGD